MTFKTAILASAFVVGIAMPAVAQEPFGVGGAITDVTNANAQSGVNAASTSGASAEGGAARATGGAGGGGGSARARAEGGVGGAGGAGGGGGRGGRGGGGGQGGSAAGGGVVNNNTIGGAGGGGGYPSTIRNTPSSTLALGTAYCQNSGGVTGSGPGFSFGAAFGRHDVDCRRFNYAMALVAMGDVEAAKLVLANNAEVNAALTEAARQRAAVRPVAVQPVGMSRATARDPRPSRADCARLRALRDPTQVQRDYLVNCS